MPINLSDLHSLFTSATGAKIPSSGIAFVLGLDHGECGGRTVCQRDQAEDFALHGIKPNDDTLHAFELGAKVGRLKTTFRNMHGGSGYGDGFKNRGEDKRDRPYDDFGGPRK